jgi:hypothetical protein
MKDIVFENIKDPKEELMELEQRVNELRSKLGMSRLVELDSVVSENAIKEAELAEREIDNDSGVEFNPFDIAPEKVVQNPEPVIPREVKQVIPDPEIVSKISNVVEDPNSD